MDKLRYILNLVIAAILLLTVAINRDGKILGDSVEDLFSEGESVELPPLRSVDPRGGEVVNSAALEEKIYGYGGKTPLLIHLSEEGVITSVELGENSETPDFLNSAIEAGLLDSWTGKTLAQAAEMKVDAVSGATMSSDAIIKNVQVAAAKAAGVSAEGGSSRVDLSLKSVIALLVILLGVVMSVMKISNKWAKRALFALNVAVLGFWCGSFLSLSLFVSWAANGVNLATSLVTVALFGAATVLPLIGRKGAYCAYHCPMGAAQELVSACNTKKIKIKPQIAKVLNNLRNAILALMLFVMWLGVGFEFMDYEIFSAFLFESASSVVLAMAGVFLLLSLFVHRPYCRFVCPTGALLTFTQKTKIENID